VKRALVAGTVVSMAVTGAWSILAAATTGPVPPLHLDWHHPVAAYLALAAAPTGNAAELFAVVASIYAVCLFWAGWRRARKATRAARDPQSPGRY
jgi:hypothetical protein